MQARTRRLTNKHAAPSYPPALPHTLTHLAIILSHFSSKAFKIFIYLLKRGNINIVILKLKWFQRTCQEFFVGDFYLIFRLNRGVSLL